MQLDDVSDSLRSAMKMLERDAARLGIDLRAPVAKAPTPLEGSRIRSVSMDYTLAMFRLLDALDEGDGSLRALRETLRRASALITPKIARLSGTDADTWRFDGIPNLLLIERVDAALRRDIEAVVERLPRDLVRTVIDSRDRLHALIAQWFDTISTADRIDLDEMVSEDRAPSPFAECTEEDD